jgi:NADH:ubiquinone oxidoreductase subunit 6 (subunit J)
VDRAEAERNARALIDAARAQRQRAPRWLWGVALAVSVVCVAALVIGWLVYRWQPVPAVGVAAEVHRSDGFAGGLAIGAAGGLAIGVLLGRRLRR